jgi:tetratricopeptide (TPR) repeat protein
MAAGKKHFEAGFACALLIVLTLAVYWPVRHFEFVNCDDPVYVTENPVVQRGLTSAGVSWAFSNIDAEFWQPLTWLSHMLDWEVYGRQAGGHHLTSLLWHIANTLLVFLILKGMTGAVWRSGFVAALFALHPLHVESVAWVAERKDVLSTFFGLLAIWAYAGYAAKSQRQSLKSKVQSPKSKAGRGAATQHATRNTRQAAGPSPSAIFRLPSSGLYILSLVLFALSLMSKPTLVTLPFLLLLLDFWPLQRLDLNAQNSKLKTLLTLLREKVPFLALTVAASVAAYWIQASRHNLGGVEQYPLPLRLANAAMSYFRYLRKTVWPNDLAVFYPYPDAWPLAQVVGAGLLLAAVSFLAIRLMGRRPYFAVGWFWYLGTLVPVIGLVQVSHHAMADRYSYVPLIGLFVVIAWGVPELLAGVRGGRAALAAGATTLVVLCAAAGRRQVTYWENSITLNQHALAVTANNFMAHENLGAAFDGQGRFDEALVQFELAFKTECTRRFNPDLTPIRYDLGTALARKGRLAEAKSHLLRALEMQPNIARIHHNLGSVLALEGKLDEAIAHYQEALRLKPDYAEARRDLANVLALRQQR